MINAEKILKILKKNKINYFTGVPDSVLEPLINILEKYDASRHLQAFNEGSAISLAVGYHLATKKIPCVYLQNSGLGNAINPLVSVANKKVYSIPLLLLIGWRGSPFVDKDEPQHEQKGKITREILKLLGIKFIIIRKLNDLKKISKIIKLSQRKKTPVALLIERGILFKKKIKNHNSFKLNYNIQRSDLIKLLLSNIKKNTKIISTTGYTSRELYQIRKTKNLKKGKDFYMVGGMGHSLMVSLGQSLNEKKNQVICLDGDGSILMHLGSMRSAGIFGKNNLKHIIINNFCHESVGGQQTFSENIDFSKVAKNLGYRKTYSVKNISILKKKLKEFLNSGGPSLLEVKTKVGHLKNLKRPKNFIKIKSNFIK